MVKKENWEMWEDDVADSLRAHKVKASGRLSLYKADVKSDTMLIDCKLTQKRSYAVTGKFWEELAMWARNESREPAIAIRCDTPFIDIAVVREPWYCYVFDKSTAGVMTKDGISKSIGAACIDGKDEFVFEVGGYRLVAFPYQQFAWKVLEIESR